MKQEASLVDRFGAEVKHSPMKSALLGVGCLVALYVWVPRLLGAAASAAPEAAPRVELNAAASAAPASASDGVLPPGAVASPDRALRDSLAIRAEFIAISKEAQELHRFADAVPLRASPRDPFARTAVAAPPEPVAEAPAEEKVEASKAEVAAEAERKAAEAIRLDGVLIFGAHAHAVVSGQLLRVGDEAAPGLSIRAIAPRAITVAGTHGEYRIEMARSSKKESLR